MNLTVNILQANSPNTLPSALLIDAEGISIDGNVNGVSTNTLTAAIADDTGIDITVSQAGYMTYSVHVNNVYHLDKTIDIVLVPIVIDILDPLYGMPTPYFFAFNDPCSFRVDVYKASSYVGNVSWYVNNVLLSGPSVQNDSITFCNPGDYQVKIRTQVSDAFSNPLWDRQFATIITGNTVKGTVGNIDTYLSQDTETNITVVEYRVCLSLEITTALSPTCDTSACCYSKDETITVTPTFTLSRPGSDPTDYTLHYDVVDPNGDPVILENADFTLDEEDLTISFALTLLGVYTVTATIVDTECGNTYVKTLDVDTCNFIVINYTGCNGFNLINKSSSISTTYTILDIEGNEVKVVATLDPGQTDSLSFPDIGIFQVVVDYTYNEEDKHEIYLINNYCELERCMSQYILNLLCASPERCDPCPDDVELNRFLLLYNTYFMKVNQIFTTNNFFTALDSEMLNTLTTVESVMQKIKQYCHRIGCLKTNGAFAEASGGWRYDWAGKSNNHIKTCNCSTPHAGSYHQATKPAYCHTCGGGNS